MGVYIEGMEMPKTCRECAYCWAGLKSCDAKYGLPVGDRWDLERASFCPLTEVPEPHGRLIDEDNLIVATKAFLPWSFETEAERGQYFQLDLFKTIIEETPTVIERNK